MISMNLYWESDGDSLFQFWLAELLRLSINDISQMHPIAASQSVPLTHKICDKYAKA
jgi:hypothetical protein